MRCGHSGRESRLIFLPLSASGHVELARETKHLRTRTDEIEADFGNL